MTQAEKLHLWTYQVLVRSPMTYQPAPCSYMNVAVECRVRNLTFVPASGAARNVVPAPAATVRVLADVLFVLMIVN